MPGACGMACEVCAFLKKGICPLDGCVAGTDERAPEKLKKETEALGFSCAILECAMRNKVDYCLSCEEFPCETHYQAGYPYSKEMLDMWKDLKEKK